MCWVVPQIHKCCCVANLKREFQTLLQACLISANFRMSVLNEMCLKLLISHGGGEILSVLRNWAYLKKYSEKYLSE